MRRREFIAGLGGAAALPFAARAQQRLPLVGFVSSGKAAAHVHNVAVFRQSLEKEGFVEGRTVAFDFRWAENQLDRLPALAADLVELAPAVIMANGLAAFRVKAATATIPLVFTTGSDPVRDGLVPSLNRPGGNVTGTVFITGALGTKRLELLGAIVPRAATIAALVNPNTTETEVERRELETAARQIGFKLVVIDVSNAQDIDAAFATAAQRGVGAIVAGAGAFVFNSSEQIVALTARYKMPAIFTARESVAAGGLMSYGTSQAEAYRQAALYVARILKGEKPADLPVMQSTKFELVINARTAKALGLEMPATLLALADEVIE
jgi:putative ABC transport system substrate-binding protein